MLIGDAVTSLRNLTCFTRLFLFMRGWGLGTSLVLSAKHPKHHLPDFHCQTTTIVFNQPASLPHVGDTRYTICTMSQIEHDQHIARIEHFHVMSSLLRLRRKTENSCHVGVRDRSFYGDLHRMSDIL